MIETIYLQLVLATWVGRRQARVIAYLIAKKDEEHGIYDIAEPSVSSTTAPWTGFLGGTGVQA